MSEPYNDRLSSHAESLLRCAVPRVVPIDEALRQHVSQAYWDWQSLFDRDLNASPLQHADFVLAELDGARATSRLEPVLLRAGSNDGEVDAVVFLRDPMTPQPHEPDINALVRACDVHNVPCATNVAGARLMLRELDRLNPAG